MINVQTDRTLFWRNLVKNRWIHRLTSSVANLSAVRWGFAAMAAAAQGNREIDLAVGPVEGRLLRSGGWSSRGSGMDGDWLKFCERRWTRNRLLLQLGNVMHLWNISQIEMHNASLGGNDKRRIYLDSVAHAWLAGEAFGPTDGRGVDLRSDCYRLHT